jgi:hypothetical protein
MKWNRKRNVCGSVFCSNVVARHESSSVSRTRYLVHSDPCVTLCNPPFAYACLWQLHFNLKLLSRLRNNGKGTRNREHQTVSHVWVCYVRSSEITSEATWLCFIYWRGSCATHVYFCRCTSCKEVDISIPVKQGCTEFVISHKERLHDRLQTSSKFEINVWVSWLFSRCRYKKGDSNDVPYQYSFEWQRDQRTVRSRWRVARSLGQNLCLCIFYSLDV